MHAHSLPPPSHRVLLDTAKHCLRTGAMRRAWASALATAMHSSRLPTSDLPALVQLLHAVGEDALAAEVAGPLDPAAMPVSDLLAMAATLTAGQYPQQAMQLVREALARAPDDTAVRLAHARLSSFLGDFDAASATLQSCIDDPQAGAFAHWQLAGLRTWTQAENHVPQLERWCREPRATREQQIFAGFALHKELDDLGEYEHAWQALRRACQIKRASIRYNSADTETLFNRLMTTGPRADARNHDCAQSIPVFIVGLHRSGTSLLHSLLGRYPGVHAAGEIYTFSKRLRITADCSGAAVIDMPLLAATSGMPLREVSSAYQREMRRRAGDATHTLDKLPSNFLLLGHILSALPEARVLHLVRDPLDVAFSSLRELFGAACMYSYDERELVDYVRHYQRLMSHWHHRFPGRILDVQFDRLLDATNTQLRRAARFCGFRDDAEPSAPIGDIAVTTASAVQARQPILKPTQRRCQPYIGFMGPLRELATDGSRPSK